MISRSFMDPFKTSLPIKELYEYLKFIYKDHLTGTREAISISTLLFIIFHSTRQKTFLIDNPQKYILSKKVSFNCTTKMKIDHQLALHFQAKNKKKSFSHAITKRETQQNYCHIFHSSFFCCVVIEEIEIYKVNFIK